MASCKVIRSEQSFSSRSESKMSGTCSGQLEAGADFNEKMEKMTQEMRATAESRLKNMQQTMLEELTPGVASVMAGMNADLTAITGAADDRMLLTVPGDSCVSKSHFKSESLRMEQTNDKVTVDGKKSEKFHDSEALGDIETSEEYHHIYEGDPKRVGIVAENDMARKLRASMYLQVDEDGQVVPADKQ